MKSLLGCALDLASPKTCYTLFLGFCTSSKVKDIFPSQLELDSKLPLSLLLRRRSS